MVISLTSCIEPNRNGTSWEKGEGKVRSGAPLKIYTKTGDGGDTGLFGGGRRVSKDHPRVEAYGQVDELNAPLGVALAPEPRALCRDLLAAGARDPFTVGAGLATPD